jgi:hypothetical protein
LINHIHFININLDSRLRGNDKGEKPMSETKIDKARLIALEYILDNIESSDFNLIHNTVRNDVASGKMNKQTEGAYKKLVDKKLKERDVK